jgi:2-methylisocitrate lyase-like PEP mutase family enzyme
MTISRRTDNDQEKHHVSTVSRQQARAEHFHRLHQDLLVLPNAWDPPSARMIAAAGAKAIATTSAGIAWSRGVVDAGGLSRDVALDAAARLVAVVELPVTLDIESGYPDCRGGVEATVEGVVEAGAVGINVEDSRDGSLLRGDEHTQVVDRIAKVVASMPVRLFVNARIDTFLLGDAEPEALLVDTIARARSYVAAGADGVFVPGVGDQDLIRTLAAEVHAPLNVMVGAGSPPIPQLAALGVRRISLGPQLAMSAYGKVREWARETLAGSLGGLPPGAASGDLVDGTSR